MVHDRAFSGPDVSAVNVLCVVETTGHEHVYELHAALSQAGMAFMVLLDGDAAAGFLHRARLQS